MGLLLPKFAADHLLVYGFYLSVAFRARLGDVLLGDGRARVGVRQYKVRCVTTRAHCRYRQAALEQTLAMNALRIIAQDVTLGNVMRQADRRTLVMTPAAQNRHLHRCGTGFRI
jgi:hypothetical protein